MGLLKRWFSFYVFGNIHVGLAAYCLTQITLAEFSIVNGSLAPFVFFSTILAYNFIRVFQIDRINGMIAVWIRSNKRSLILLNAACLGLLIYFSLDFNLYELLILLPFLLTSFFYVVPLSSTIRGLRNIPGLKLFLISFTWAGVTVYFPLFVSGLQDAEGVWIVFMQRLLFIMAITIPFDIRDAEFDFPDLRTVPQMIGINNSKVFATVAMIIFVLLELSKNETMTTLITIAIVIAGVSVLAILFAGVRQKRFYSSFWVESIPVLWYLLLIIFS